MEIKRCKNCGKELIGKDYRAIFCSRSCAGTYNNTGRKHTEEERLKISQALQRRQPGFNGEYKPIDVTQHRNYDTFNASTKYYCLNCGKEIKSIYPSKANKFCNVQCQSEYRYNEYIDKWKKGEVDGLRGKYSIPEAIRKYMLIKTGYRCERCGFEGKNPYTNKTILQLHHLDGDCTNNTESNLQVLCPNCHAMTDNFGNRNKNATSGRSKYFGKV